MIFRFLYIDDEPSNITEDVIATLQNDELTIEVHQPRSFDMQLDELAASLKNFDGLILDWRLDLLANTDGQKVAYRAGALAQEIRTRETERDFQAIPIILLSSEERLARSFDKTSSDLFDVKYEKDRLASMSDVARIQIMSLAQGYRAITKARRKLQTCLNLSKEQFDTLDPRFSSILEGREDSLPHHEIARLILVDLVLRPGLLVDEERLAARLGVDLTGSEDWRQFLNSLPASTKYSGVFADGWPRWWIYEIEQVWWRETGQSVPAISRLNAKERVEVLKQATSLERLVPAEPIEPQYKTTYRTICEVLKRPLDPSDGAIIKEDEPKAWQERRYISLHAIFHHLNESSETPIEIHPLERDRIRTLRRSRRS